MGICLERNVLGGTIMMKEETNIPLISVIMGIYNCEDTLREAIDSIVNQTFTDWELILCDDGSKDNTCNISKEYEKAYPDKIIVLRNDENRGLNYTLNHCLKHARGKYIARMDGDDRCSTKRLEKELTILEQEKDIAIVSTDMEHFDETGRWGRISHPEYPQKSDLIYETPFCHAPCLVKKEAYEAVGGYSEAKWTLRVEDYHLWTKMYAAGYKGKNIHEPLYQMRDDRKAYARRKFKYRINETLVKLYAVKVLKLPVWKSVYAVRPILVGLMPTKLYDYLHKKRLNK